MLKGWLEEEKEKEKKKNRGKQSNNKMALDTYLSIITLNVNGLNAPTKRHRVPEWIRKQDPHICCPKRPISDQKIHID